MAEPIKLHKVQPVAEVVETLERLLDEARAGDILGIAYSIEAREGFVRTGWTASPNIHYLKSGVMTLFSRLCLKGLVEEIED